MVRVNIYFAVFWPFYSLFVTLIWTFFYEYVFCRNFSLFLKCVLALPASDFDWNILMASFNGSHSTSAWKYKQEQIKTDFKCFQRILSFDPLSYMLQIVESTLFLLNRIKSAHAPKFKCKSI